MLGYFAQVHLFAVDDDVRWRGDAETDLVPAETHHCDDDIVADSQGFVGTAAEDEHESHSLSLTEWSHSNRLDNRMTRSTWATHRRRIR